jgi:hypothetical protein
MSFTNDSLKVCENGWLIIGTICWTLSIVWGILISNIPQTMDNIRHSLPIILQRYCHNVYYSKIIYGIWQWIGKIYAHSFLYAQIHIIKFLKKSTMQLLCICDRVYRVWNIFQGDVDKHHIERRKNMGRNGGGRGAMGRWR